MKIIFILFFFIICFSVSASITDELIKLSDMYKQGLLTETEFKKAKSILLEIQEIDNSQKEIISKEKKKKKYRR